MYYYFNNNGTMLGAYSFRVSIENAIEIETSVSYTGTVRLVDGQIVEQKEDSQGITKEQVLQTLDEQTSKWITSYFKSNANGVLAYYDCEKEDQITFSAMYSASQSPAFETTEPYNGRIPIRARLSLDGEKQVYYHNKDQMQKLMDDLALHIGACKIKGWHYQEQIDSATDEQLQGILQSILSEVI